jgi:hypothetical protein
MTKKIALAIALLIAQSSILRAAILYSMAGSTYSENFNGLPTDMPDSANSIQGVYVNGWQDDTTTVSGDHVSVPGWYLWHPLDPSGTEDGTNHHQRLRNGAGQNTGAFWAFSGTATDSEKALGSIGSTTVAANNDNMLIVLRLTNNTGATLDTFTVTYDGEEWRDGQLATPESLFFGYNLGATTVVNGSGVPNWADPATTYTAVPTLNFTSPVFAGTNSAGTNVDGNTAGKISGITATVSGISWAPGTDLWLRWADPQVPSAADDGLAVDNVSFSANAIVLPEPSAAALTLLVSVAIFGCRRVSK